MNTIKLDEKWSIVPDTYSWCLQKEVEKERKKKDGVKEKYTDFDKWYFPTIKGCLERYTNESTKKCKDLQEVLQKLQEIKETVEKVRKIYVKEGTLIQTD